MSREPRRYWVDARAKVEFEHHCRLCWTPNYGLEAAHVVGREHDTDDGAGAGYDLYVHPDSIVPLCRECHRRYDAHEVDLLPRLRLEEQTRAVRDAGGIELMRRRTAPLAYREVERLRRGLEDAADDLGKAANQFASIREAQRAGHVVAISRNPDIFLEKEARARTILEAA